MTPGGSRKTRCVEETALIEEGKTGVIKGFKKRDGSLMDAKLKLDENYKTVFEFPMKKSNLKKR